MYFKRKASYLHNIILSIYELYAIYELYILLISYAFYLFYDLFSATEMYIAGDILRRRELFNHMRYANRPKEGDF